MGILGSFVERLVVRGATLLLYVAQYGCVAHCTLEFVGDVVVCSGPSMEPTIHSHDILLTEHISPALHQITKGDIIIARSPTNPRQFVCKRVVGMPGDRVSSHFIPTYVPKGHVWLEGDNKNNSTDSRTYGAIPQALIRSRALFKVWPLHDAQSLSSSGTKR